MPFVNCVEKVITNMKMIIRRNGTGEAKIIENFESGFVPRIGDQLRWFTVTSLTIVSVSWDFENNHILVIGE